MAERLFLHALAAEEEPLKSVNVTSAGVFAADGESASVNALKALESVGIDLNGHRSQRLTQDLVDKSLVLICMTQAHRNIIESEYNTQKTGVHLMGKFLKTPHDIDIPDPFGQNLDTYKACRDSLVEAIPNLMDFLKQKFKCH